MGKQLLNCDYMPIEWFVNTKFKNKPHFRPFLRVLIGDLTTGKGFFTLIYLL